MPQNLFFKDSTNCPDYGRKALVNVLSTIFLTRNCNPFWNMAFDYRALTFFKAHRTITK